VSNDTTSATKIVIVFIISSAFGSFKEIELSLMSFKVKGNELTSYTEEVYKLVIACSFKVIAIITDNNRVNRVILGCQISPFRFFPLYSMLYKKCYSDRI